MIYSLMIWLCMTGHLAVPLVVRRWLPTAARVRVRAACGFCSGQSGSGAGFLRILRFPLSIIPPISPLSWSRGAGTIGLLVAAVPSGPNWTPHPTIPIKKLINCDRVRTEVNNEETWLRIAVSRWKFEPTTSRVQFLFVNFGPICLTDGFLNSKADSLDEVCGRSFYFVKWTSNPKVLEISSS
jgi:hypothetical protein